MRRGLCDEFCHYCFKGAHGSLIKIYFYSEDISRAAVLCALMLVLAAQQSAALELSCTALADRCKRWCLSILPHVLKTITFNRNKNNPVTSVVKNKAKGSSKWPATVWWCQLGWLLTARNSLQSAAEQFHSCPCRRHDNAGDPQVVKIDPEPLSLWHVPHSPGAQFRQPPKFQIFTVSNRTG